MTISSPGTARRNRHHRSWCDADHRTVNSNAASIAICDSKWHAIVIANIYTEHRAIIIANVKHNANAIANRKRYTIHHSKRYAGFAAERSVVGFSGQRQARTV